MQIWTARERHRRTALELQIETEITARWVRLMHFDGNDIRTGHEQRRAQGSRDERRFVRANDGSRCQRGVIDRACRHVRPKDFRAVQVHNRAVISQDAQHEACVLGRIGNRERAPEVRRDVFRARVTAVAHDGCFVAISVAKLRRPHRPRGVVERGRLPRSALVGPVVEVAPSAPRGYEDGRLCAERRRRRSHERDECEGEPESRV